METYKQMYALKKAHKQTNKRFNLLRAIKENEGIFYKNNNKVSFDLMKNFKLVVA